MYFNSSHCTFIYATRQGADWQIWSPQNQLLFNAWSDYILSQPASAHDTWAPNAQLSEFVPSAAACLLDPDLSTYSRWNPQFDLDLI